MFLVALHQSFARASWFRSQYSASPTAPQAHLERSHEVHDIESRMTLQEETPATVEEILDSILQGETVSEDEDNSEDELKLPSKNVSPPKHNEAIELISRLVT
ncbi:hypothetical protein QAD02_017428 [Eretmocerus hayati]|uniref:Uncharacterized protein n=1 Tax=Eretmocerus hayati TaxID=131215 RepID=A0ACC2PDU9_9HYME|nr:hypothetical protein QAD02_017428 [Eretmocerus hayati]